MSLETFQDIIRSYTEDKHSSELCWEIEQRLRAIIRDLQRENLRLREELESLTGSSLPNGGGD